MKHKLHWALVWLIQAIIMALISAFEPFLYLVINLFLPASEWLCNIYLWGILPMVGLLCALRAVHFGLNCYIAWIAPPVVMSAVIWIVLGFPPAAGSMLLCALLSVAGAATGEVIRRYEP